MSDLRYWNETYEICVICKEKEVCKKKKHFECEDCLSTFQEISDLACENCIDNILTGIHQNISLL